MSVEINKFLRDALNLKEELISARRYIHSLAEIGFDVSKTANFIQKTLSSFGVESTRTACNGVVALIGKKLSPVFLLRADFDALPFKEESGLPFASTGDYCHACGHDMHTTMLLYAAKLLKDYEGALNGTVKLMFQPAEELGGGADRMVEEGILENPSVDAVFALHVSVADDASETGKVYYSSGGCFSSCDIITMKVLGKACHGAAPQNGVDPISVAAHIITALQQISAREIASSENVIITFGSIHGGATPNAIPNVVELKGTLRTFDSAIREFCISRIHEVTEGVAKAMRADVEIDIQHSADAVINDGALCHQLYPFVEAAAGSENCAIWNKPTSYGSEDFSALTNRVPGVAARIGAGSIKEGYTFPLHHPAVRFNEEALPTGAAVYASAAYGWLAEHGDK